MKASGHSPPTKPGQHKQAAKQSPKGRRGRTTAASAGCRHERIRATAFVHLAIAVVVDTVAADLTLPGVYPAIVIVAVPVFGRDPVAVQVAEALVHLAVAVVVDLVFDFFGARIDLAVFIIAIASILGEPIEVVIDSRRALVDDAIAVVVLLIGHLCLLYTSDAADE